MALRVFVAFTGVSLSFASGIALWLCMPSPSPAPQRSRDLIGARPCSSTLVDSRSWKAPFRWGPRRLLAWTERAAGPSAGRQGVPSSVGVGAEVDPCFGSRRVGRPARPTPRGVRREPENCHGDNGTRAPRPSDTFLAVATSPFLFCSTRGPGHNRTAVTSRVAR